jgi:hypothetical protein
MYIETAWGKWLSWFFGGYESALTIHIYVGIFMIGGFVLHVVYILFKINWKQFPGSLYGPDSILFRPKDLKDFFHHIAWFLGLKKAPEFDRWGYWEKFDYFAVFWGIIILGVTTRMGVERGFLDSSDRGPAGHGPSICHSFLCRPSAASQFSDGSGHV